MENRKRGGDDLSLDNLAEFRQSAYRIFSSLLMYPEEERLGLIINAAPAVSLPESQLSTLAIYPVWKQLINTVTSLVDTNCSSLAAHYVSIFLHSSEFAPCLMYESVYLDPDRRSAGWVIAGVEGEYAESGMSLSSSTKELPDHATVELEFMSYLCGREVDAWNSRDETAAGDLLNKQSGFIERHLIKWIPMWANRVIEAEGGKGIYSVVARSLNSFIVHDSELIRVIKDSLRETSDVNVLANSLGSGEKIDS